MLRARRGAVGGLAICQTNHARNWTPRKQVLNGLRTLFEDVAPIVGSEQSVRKVRSPVGWTHNCATHAIVLLYPSLTPWYPPPSPKRPVTFCGSVSNAPTETRPACKTPSPRSWSRAIIAMILRRLQPAWCAATTLSTLFSSIVRTLCASAAFLGCCRRTRTACMPCRVLARQSTDAPASLRSFKRPRSTPQQAKRQSRNGSAIAHALRTRCFVLLAYIRALRWRAPGKISCSSFQLPLDCLEIRTLNVGVAGCISAPSARMLRV